MSNHSYQRRKRPKPPAPAVTAAMRRPTAAEQAGMHEALDQFVADEQAIRAQHRSPNYGRLYDPGFEQLMDDVVAGRMIDPEAMWTVLDAFDQFSRQASASPRHYPDERRAMRDLMEAGP
jgi:hypothetical protein